MLQLGKKRETLSVVHDQIGGPTPARELAKASIEIANQLRIFPEKTGTYHFSGKPDLSWCEFANEIFNQAGLTTTAQKIMSSEYPTPAKRPLNSCLDCSETKETFGIQRPLWRENLGVILQELGVGRDIS